jgi:uncharacterized protein
MRCTRSAAAIDAACRPWQICSRRWRRLTRLAPDGYPIDFVDAEKIFAGPTFSFEDDRFAYGERRFVTLGLLKGVPVSIVHTENEDEIRVISFRKATSN